jgi:3-hydroxyacyl-CoA dehydrogenase
LRQKRFDSLSMDCVIVKKRASRTITRSKNRHCPLDLSRLFAACRFHQETPAWAQLPPAVVTTGDVLVVTINNPPVNALGVAVRQGLLAPWQQAQADSAVAAVLLVGAGKAFIAGADIREFGKPPMPPSLPEVCRASKAAQARGGRAARRGAGRWAGSGAVGPLPPGTARRQAGPARSEPGPAARLGRHAARAAPDGRAGRHRAHAQRQHLSAKAALAGLVDQLAEGDDAQAAGLAYLQRTAGAKAPVRRTRDLAIADPGSAGRAGRAKADTAKKTRGLFSPLKIIECVQAAVQLPFDEGLARERALFWSAWTARSAPA